MYRTFNIITYTLNFIGDYNIYNNVYAVFLF